MTRIERFLCYSAILLPFLALALLPILARGFLPSPRFEVTNVLFCKTIDENKRPLEITTVFPERTKQVYCWFSWKNGTPGVRLITRWYYLDDNSLIIDIPVTLTRNTSEGAISLVMPEGKILPAGSYAVEFEVQGKIVKAARFKVEGAKAPYGSLTPSAVPAVSPSI